ncbi:MAG: arsenosugar biosynthesis radical SAM (seleno)protein ArsS [Planctomycetia bacterium]
MAGLTLLRRQHPLAEPAAQRTMLAGGSLPTFEATLAAHGQGPLAAVGVDTLQINVGRLCNQTCRHCHVDAGPDRREIMTRETLEDCLAAVRRGGVKTVDVTGGAPEMNPHFRWFVGELRALGVRVVDRCNLTILLAPGFTDLPEFLATHHVEIVASLPCYLPENTDKQRGDGVFWKSIDALKKLNELGYGKTDTGLTLSLVYNPVGWKLPPDQTTLEAAYHQELSERYGVTFNRLYTITNMPVSRFLDDLCEAGRFDEYMSLLVDSFNLTAAEGVMCRSLVSVGWDGLLYDCDFNQMLELPVRAGLPRHIRDFAVEPLGSRRIAVGRHCFGCTAGAGSSCQGATT